MGKLKLFREIVSLSVADNWEDAKDEWKLSDIYFLNERDTCLFEDIVKLYKLKNKKSKEIAIVGNSCVNKFIGLPSDKIFQAVKRIRKDNNMSYRFGIFSFVHNYFFFGCLFNL